MVDTHFPGGWASREAREEWSLEARSLLKRCFLPDLDVLLPMTSSAAEAERFFIAAFADDASAAALASRIRGQFERLVHLTHGGLTLSVSYSMLPPIPRDGGAVDTLVSDMAIHLENAVTSHTISGAVNHE